MSQKVIEQVKVSIIPLDEQLIFLAKVLKIDDIAKNSSEEVNIDKIIIQNYNLIK